MTHLHNILKWLFIIIRYFLSKIENIVTLWATIDAVLDWMLDLLTNLTYNS
jgi:hypothetical protein